MRIALLTDSIEADAPGFAGYATNLARALLDALPGSVTLVHRREHPFYRTVPHAIPEERAFPGVPLRIRRQMCLPGWLDSRGFEVVHDTYHFGPFLRTRDFARVLTIGDLTPIVSTGAPTSARLAHRFLLPTIARRAERIITFSEHSRRDIERVLRIPGDKVTVTLLAASEAFRPHARDKIEEGRNRLGLPRRYLLFVGSVEPRKNIARLVKAFAIARPRLEGTQLLLVGRRSWGTRGLREIIDRLNLHGDVVTRRDITNDDLPLVYAGAIGLVYPSLYEGFGLPPLEAMQCGTPVVTSNVTSLPEVVGDDALLVDPRSVDGIAHAMVELARNDLLRRSLSERGLVRARQFSWKRCAETTIGAYEAAYSLARQRAGRLVA